MTTENESDIGPHANIYLKPGDAALVLCTDGSMDIYMPTAGEDEEATDGAIIITALAGLLHDKDGISEVVSRYVYNNPVVRGQ